MKAILVKAGSQMCKYMYWPLCRVYIRCILGDKPADPMFRWLCSPQFWITHGLWPDFVRPRRFSEKLWHRMLYDRNPLLTMISDKLRVRDYVAERVGDSCLIPLLWSGTDPKQIPFHALPSQFVIKANHGCGYNIIVKDKAQLDEAKVVHQVQRWLIQNFGQNKYMGIAWGYSNIKPAILIETFLGEHGSPPVDYKFYCFSGRAEIVTLHLDRFGAHRILAFNRDFELHEAGNGFGQDKTVCQAPGNYREMLQLAECLSREFGFMRVDLYAFEGKVFFGELTPYPGGVTQLHGFDVSRVDLLFGRLWKDD